LPSPSMRQRTPMLAAQALGDDTAAKRGRLSLNSLKHIDPVGTVVLPSLLIVLRSPFLFGYAKPVPVNFHALRHPRRDMVLVAIAGPVTNLALAALSAAALRRLGHHFPAVFNMLPIPPLERRSRAAWPPTQAGRSALGATGALRHTDSPRGNVRIASCWAATRHEPRCALLGNLGPEQRHS
jgi:Zn-dependent protease